MTHIFNRWYHKIAINLNVFDKSCQRIGKIQKQKNVFEFYLLIVFICEFFEWTSLKENTQHFTNKQSRYYLGSLLLRTLLSLMEIYIDIWFSVVENCAACSSACRRICQQGNDIKIPWTINVGSICGRFVLFLVFNLFVFGFEELRSIIMIIVYKNNHHISLDETQFNTYDIRIYTIILVYQRKTAVLMYTIK